MNILDYKIRRLAGKSNYPKSAEMDEKIDNLLNEMVNEKYKKDKRNMNTGKRIAVAFSVMILICLLAVPVKAAIDYVQKRMEQVSDSEQQNIYKEQQEAKGEEAITYSRSLSEQEQQRYDELTQKYENEGMLPGCELAVMEDCQEQLDYPVYLTKGRVLLLPERELTDDELLQIIDYYHVADYSMRNISQNMEDAEETDETVTDVSIEDRVYQKAVLYLENLKEFEYEQYTVETTYSKGDGVYEDMYIVNFVRDGMSECEVCISANDERLISISINDESKDYYAASAEVTNDLIDFLKEKTTMLCQSYSEYPVEELSFVEYKADEEGKSSSGNVNVYCVLANGDAYCFRYNILEEEFWYIYYVQDIEQYKETQQSKDKEYDEERGVTLKWISF